MFSRSMSGALLLGLFGALVPAAPVEGGARWDVRTPAATSQAPARVPGAFSEAEVQRIVQALAAMRPATGRTPEPGGDELLSAVSGTRS